MGPIGGPFGPMGFPEILVIFVLVSVKLLFLAAVVAAIWKAFMMDRKIKVILAILEEIRSRPSVP